MNIPSAAKGNTRWRRTVRRSSFSVQREHIADIDFQVHLSRICRDPQDSIIQYRHCRQIHSKGNSQRNYRKVGLTLPTTWKFPTATIGPKLTVRRNLNFRLSFFSRCPSREIISSPKVVYRQRSSRSASVTSSWREEIFRTSSPSPVRQTADTA